MGLLVEIVQPNLCFGYKQSFESKKVASGAEFRGVNRRRARGRRGSRATSLCRLEGYRKHVCAGGQHRRLRFEPARHAQQILSTAAIGQPLGNVGKNPSRPLDSKQPHHLKPRVQHFRAQILRPVEVGGGEVVERPGEIAVLTVAQVRATMAANCGSSNRSRARPSRAEAQRLTAAANRQPPGLRTRAASSSAPARS